MSIVRAQVVLNLKTGIPRDAVTNTFHFDAGSEAVTADLTSIADALATLYAGLGTDGILGASVATAANAHRVKVTNLGEWPGGPVEPAGPPDLDQSFTTAAVAGSTLPQEVALAVTFEAGSQRFSEEVGSTRPAARRRGRVFIGPLAGGIGQAEGTTGVMYLNPANRDLILARFVTMQNTLADLTNPIAHTVLSRTAALNTPVESYSMDDAYDVIRSRGVRARTRARVAASEIFAPAPGNTVTLAS